MGLAFDQVPVGRSYSSAEARVMPVLPYPPATSTRPLVRSVAVWWARGVAIALVFDQAPVLGSNSSATSRALGGPLPPRPPATRTRPSFSRVAVGSLRAVT